MSDIVDDKENSDERASHLSHIYSCLSDVQLNKEELSCFMQLLLDKIHELKPAYSADVFMKMQVHELFL
jgi:hypothetical protein